MYAIESELAVNIVGVCVHIRTHFDMLLLIPVSHVQRLTPLSVCMMWGCVSVHAQAYMNTHNSWPDTVSTLLPIGLFCHVNTLRRATGLSLAAPIQPGQTTLRFREGGR